MGAGRVLSHAFRLASPDASPVEGGLCSPRYRSGHPPSCRAHNGSPIGTAGTGIGKAAQVRGAWGY